MTQEMIQNFKEYFENDLKNHIPKMVHEYAAMQNFTDEEEAETLKAWQLVDYSKGDRLIYTFFEEPTVCVTIADGEYRVRASNQFDGSVMSFRSEDPGVFIRFWNSDIISYWQYTSSIPEMKF